MIRNTGSFEKDFRAASGNLIHEGMELSLIHISEPTRPY